MRDDEVCALTVDVMGGDDAPAVVFEGIDLALDADPSLRILACGPAEIVEEFAAERPDVEPLRAEEVIGMGEHPAVAVKAKKDSSIVVGCRSVAEGRAQGFFSAGSTGAVLTAATLKIGRIKGVKRPALGQILPAYEKPTLLVDVGANAECKAEYLVQFALMGSIYMEKILGVAAPTCALLNIGAEETKGTPLAQEAYGLLKERLPRFAGNAEGRDITSGAFDVIVTDGFTGNVVLKNIEGTASMLFRYVKDALTASFKNKIGAALVKGDLAALKSKLSPDTYGGTPLLGVRGACIVGHGSSNARAIANGIAVCAKTVRGDVAGIIAEALGGDR